MARVGIEPTLFQLTVEVDNRKILDNPINDIALVSVLRSQIGGFTDNELIKIRLEEPKKSFYEAMKIYKNEESCENQNQCKYTCVK